MGVYRFIRTQGENYRYQYALHSVEYEEDTMSLGATPHLGAQVRHFAFSSAVSAVQWRTFVDEEFSLDDTSAGNKGVVMQRMKHEKDAKSNRMDKHQPMTQIIKQIRPKQIGTCK
eukprot:632234_1